MTGYPKNIHGLFSLFLFLFLASPKSLLISGSFFFGKSEEVNLPSDDVSFCGACLDGKDIKSSRNDAYLWHHKYVYSDPTVDKPCSVEKTQWSISKMVYFIFIVIVMLVGLASAAGLGCIVALWVFLKSGKKYQPSSQLPIRLQALHLLKKVIYAFLLYLSTSFSAACQVLGLAIAKEGYFWNFIKLAIYSVVIHVITAK